MIDEVITEGLPKGWMIVRLAVPDGRDLDFFYAAYQWKRIVVKKRWFHKPKTESRWVEAGFRSHWSDAVRSWIMRTTGEAEDDMFDVTAKGYGHVAILLNGEVVSRVETYSGGGEVVANAKIRWTSGDQLTYDNAHYASATRLRGF